MDDRERLSLDRLLHEKQKLEAQFNQLAQEIQQLERSLREKHQQVQRLDGAYSLLLDLIKAFDA